MKENKTSFLSWISRPFQIFVILLIAVLAYVIIFAWGKIDSFAVAYELSLPEPVVQSVIDDFTNGEFEKYVTSANFDTNKFEEKNDITQNLDMNLSHTYEYSKRKNTEFYLIQSGVKIADIMLNQVASTNEFDLPTYEFDSITFDASYSNEVSVRVPSGAMVYINDVLTEQDDFTSVTPIEIVDFSGDVIGVESPQYSVVAYDLMMDGFLNPPTVTVMYPDVNQPDQYIELYPIDTENSADDVAWVEDCLYYNVETLLTEQEKEKIEQITIDVSKKYAAFTSGDMNYSDIKNYFMQGTTSLQRIASYDSYWYIEHDGYEYGDIDVYSTRLLNDDIIECCITIDYTVIRGYRRYDYPSHYIFYFDRNTQTIVSLTMG